MPLRPNRHLVAALLLALLATALPGVAVASYELGMQAFKAEKFDAARDIWEEAAEQGDQRAQFELGRLYEKGKGRMLRRDYPSAIHWYNAAARQGHPGALFALGRMSEEGDGMRQNYLQAMRYYSLAVKYSGLPEAHFALGQMFFHGRGVPQDYLKAIENYIAAAQRGYAPAQYVYGALLEQGWGVRRDLVAAYVWYSLAAKVDPKVLQAISMNFDAREAVSKIRRRLSEHDLFKAEKMLRDWKSAAQKPPE
jgi:hypothetical protein